MNPPIDKQLILGLIQDGEWESLCHYYHDWLAEHCSEYRLDDIEGIVGSWVSRMVIVKAQLSSKIHGEDQSGWRLLYDYKKNLVKVSNEKKQEWADNQLRREIDGHWNEAYPTYLRALERWRNPPLATVKVAETIKNIEARQRHDAKPDALNWNTSRRSATHMGRPIDIRDNATGGNES